MHRINGGVYYFQRSASLVPVPSVDEPITLVPPRNSVDGESSRITFRSLKIGSGPGGFWG